MFYRLEPVVDIKLKFVLIADVVEVLKVIVQHLSFLALIISCIFVYIGCLRFPVGLFL